MTDVSVIVLGWNGRRWVQDCLSSVLDQDFARPYEVLFIDNGSTDGTADEAASFEGVAVHRLDRNYGFCEGNNKAFALATGQLVVFLNQDVVVHRAWLRELVAAVESDDAIKAAHANIVHPWNQGFDQQDRLSTPTRAYTPELSRFAFVEYRDTSIDRPFVDTLFVSGAALILKRDVVAEIGGYVFDPGMFAYGEDMDLALRLHGRGYRTGVATRAVVYHHHVLHDAVSLKTFLRAVRIIRNRLLALWKSSSWSEYPPIAAIALVGAPLNAGQWGVPWRKRAMYFVALVPPTILAAFVTVLSMPAYAARRRDVLAHRRRKGWLLRALLFDRSRKLETGLARREAVA